MKYKKEVLPFISPEEFQRRLRQRPHEDWPLIQTIEKQLLKKRNYIVQLPPPQSSVLLLFSGGVDSVVTWGVLMAYFHLRVIPIFFKLSLLDWGQEEFSVRYFSFYYSHRFPNLFVKPKIFPSHLPFSGMFKNMLYSENWNPDDMLDYFLRLKYGLLGNVGPFFFRALQIAQVLEYLGDGTRIIISAITADDSNVTPEASLTFQRLLLLSGIKATGDWRWQYFALPFEKQLGFWWGKKEILGIGNSLGIPLEKTWSCYGNDAWPCGTCPACSWRRQAARAARIKDKAIYLSEIPLLRRCFTSSPRWRRVKTLCRFLFNHLIYYYRKVILLSMKLKVYANIKGGVKENE